jgi:CRP-like cAMP-binding protein
MDSTEPILFYLVHLFCFYVDGGFSMQGKYSIDRGMRIMGGFVLTVLGATIGNLESVSRVVAIIVGLYSFITGILNFCPLVQGIVREKEVQRKKTAANHTMRVSDVKGLEFFTEFSDEEIDKILAQCQLKEYAEGETALAEGNLKKRTLSIIYSGQFKIVKAISDIENKIITTISDGEAYGEMSFFDNRPPCASVISVEHAKVLEIVEEAYNVLIEEYPKLALKMNNRLLRTMSGRIRALNEQIASLGNWVLQGRLQSNI